MPLVDGLNNNNDRDHEARSEGFVDDDNDDDEQIDATPPERSLTMPPTYAQAGRSSHQPCAVDGLELNAALAASNVVKLLTEE
jgi:hypothetical protein